MTRNLVKLFDSLAYLNVILTVIAIILALNLFMSVGVLAPRSVQAKSVMPVQIESVRGNIPVEIKGPVSGYPNAVCVSTCK